MKYHKLELNIALRMPKEDGHKDWEIRYNDMRQPKLTEIEPVEYEQQELF